MKLNVDARIFEELKRSELTMSQLQRVLVDSGSTCCYENVSARVGALIQKGKVEPVYIRGRIAYRAVTVRNKKVAEEAL